jgi:hypothetical protein
MLAKHSALTDRVEHASGLEIACRESGSKSAHSHAAASSWPFWRATASLATMTKRPSAYARSRGEQDGAGVGSRTARAGFTWESRGVAGSNPAIPTNFCCGVTPGSRERVVVASRRRPLRHNVNSRERRNAFEPSRSVCCASPSLAWVRTRSGRWRPGSATTTVNTRATSCGRSAFARDLR